MFKVFFFGFTIDQYIIEEYHDRFIQIGSEELLHHMHEGGWCVAEAILQHQELERTVSSPDGSFMNIFWLDSDLMISTPQINLAEPFGSM